MFNAHNFADKSRPASLHAHFSGPSHSLSACQPASSPIFIATASPQPSAVVIAECTRPRMRSPASTTAYLNCIGAFLRHRKPAGSLRDVSEFCSTLLNATQPRVLATTASMCHFTPMCVPIVFRERVALRSFALGAKVCAVWFSPFFLALPPPRQNVDESLFTRVFGLL